MVHRRADGVVHALHAGAPEADHLTVDARLRSQESKRRVEVADPRLPRPYRDRGRRNRRPRVSPCPRMSMVSTWIPAAASCPATSAQEPRFRLLCSKRIAPGPGAAAAKNVALSTVPSGAVRIDRARGRGRLRRNRGEEEPCRRPPGGRRDETRTSHRVPGRPASSAACREQNSPIAARCIRFD